MRQKYWRIQHAQIDTEITDKMLATAYNTQNNNLQQNVGAPCKMSAPYVKCRRLKCRRPRQNVGALCKMSAPLNVGVYWKMSALMKYSKSKKQLRHTRIILSPRSNCTCTKYSKSKNMCAYMKCWRCAAKAFYSCPAIISQRLESQIIPKEPQENTEEESKII